MAFFNPTKRAQMAHITNLISLASIDGEISENEKNFIVKTAQIFGLTQEEFNQCFKDSDNLVIEVPKSDDDKVEYLKNVVVMMMADGHIDEKEREFAEYLAEEFGYNGKEAIDIIYDEVLKETKEKGPDSDNGSGESESEMTEEEFREEMNRRIKKGAECLADNDMSEAFEQLFYAALADETARRLFLRIPRGVYPSFMLTDEQVAEMKDLADKGYAIAKYALGRYHLLVQPDEDSIDQARDLFAAAAKGGIVEAILGTALLYRDGYFGEADFDKFISLRDEAIEKGSVKAFYMKAKDIIYGANGYEADPKHVLDFVSNILKAATGEVNKDIFDYEPEYYDLLGRAYETLGDIDKAEEAYIQAVSMGYYESLAQLIYMMCYDEDGNLVEKEMYDKYIGIGCEHNDAYSFTLRGDVKDEEFEALNPREKVKKTAQIKADLEKAYDLGDNIAPLILGNNYYYGSLGFEENNKEAWKWYNLGAVYGSPSCYGMMATMIEDGNCPRKVDEGFRAYCVLCAYRRGDDDRLEDVIIDYQKGLLDDYKDEIEKHYLPKYENMAPVDEDPDYIELGGRANNGPQTSPGLIDEGIPLIAIIRPNCTADIIEFDVANWDEMPEFIGADRLDALRVQPLYEIGHKAGYKENVAGWIDAKALMKKLQMNEIGRKVYPGPVAGDMILTLEDKDYNPKSFYDINALRRVLLALGATIENICLDDDIDDDGRFDAWS